MNDSKAVILLTACVNPNGMAFTYLQDVDSRVKQYKEALRFYHEQTNLRILFAENTLYDFRGDFSQYIESGRLEYLTFDGNNFDRLLGKGYGEAQMIKYALENSVFLQSASCIIKITGRLIIENINSLIRHSGLNNERTLIACNIRPQKRLGTSMMFIAKKDFFTSYFLPRIEEIDDSKKIWFEHVLYESILSCEKDKYKSHVFPYPIKIKGVAGTTSKDYPKVTFIDYVLSFGASFLHNYLGVYESLDA